MTMSRREPMLLNEEEIANRLAARPEWRLNGGLDGGLNGEKIVRHFTFANFRAALDFVNQVGEAAEAADHHPDILIHDWNKVELSLTTHSAAGLTWRDFELAEKIDALVQPSPDL